MKPVLIGMNNPLSMQPGYELFPAPEGCTGHRIYLMLKSRQPDILRQQYLNVFDRRNLVVGRSFDKKLARVRAEQLYAEFWGTKRTIVLLGEEVRRAFGHPKELIHPQEIGGCTWRQLPHPSGRNFWYNVTKNREMAAMLLEELYLDYTKEITHAGH